MKFNKDVFNFTSRFNLEEGYFDHQSNLHGIKHTYRVMTHCLILGHRLGHEHEGKVAFCAAYIHDMARKNDRTCHGHGRWSAETKLPIFTPFFNSIGISGNDIEAIKTAVTWHSLPDEIEEGHKFDRTVALLKDADALDRVRLNPAYFDLHYLRFPDTKNLVQYAEKLYRATNDSDFKLFSDYLSLAVELVGQD